MRLRAATPEDALAVTDLIIACDVADFGRPDFTVEDLQGEWALNGFDLDRDALVCEEEGHGILGYAAIGRIASVALVTPGHRGRGIGRSLMDWVLARERELGRARHRQAIASTNKPAAALLRSGGYRSFLEYSRMVMDLAEPPPPAFMPAGVALRALDRLRDARALHALDDEAFSGYPDYVPMSLDEFCEEHLDEHDGAPECSFVAEQDGELVGFVLSCRRDEETVGYVDILAVRPGRQGRGVGSALLRSALMAFAAAGFREAQLGVSSVNAGARRLYERLGMHELFRFDVFQLLDPGQS